MSIQWYYSLVNALFREFVPEWISQFQVDIGIATIISKYLECCLDNFIVDIRSIIFADFSHIGIKYKLLTVEYNIIQLEKCNSLIFELQTKSSTHFGISKCLIKRTNPSFSWTLWKLYNNQNLFSSDMIEFWSNISNNLTPKSILKTYTLEDQKK